MERDDQLDFGVPYLRHTDVLLGLRSGYGNPGTVESPIVGFQRPWISSINFPINQSIWGKQKLSQWQLW